MDFSIFSTKVCEKRIEIWGKKSHFGSFFQHQQDVYADGYIEYKSAQ